MYAPSIIARNREALERHYGVTFKESSLSEVEELRARIDTSIDRDGKVLRNLTSEEEQFIFNEIQLSKIDFAYWCERWCKVSDDKGRLTNLRLRPSQLKLLKKFGDLEAETYPLPQGKAALVLVKARRIGATVLGQAMLSHGVLLRSQAQGLTASDIPENTLKLDQIQNRIYEGLPFWMKPKLEGKVKADHLRFPGLDSDLVFGTGNQKNPLGQGVRLDFIHLTELGTWLYPEMLDDDLLPAFLSSGVPTSFLFLESTAKSDQASGFWFEQQYRQAKDVKGVYRSAFVSWYDCPEIHTIPGGEAELNAKTRQVAERIKRDTGYECTKDQLAWYQITREQYEAKNRLQSFLSEYPSSDDEAFQTGFNSAFSLETRDRIRQTVKKPEMILRWDEGKKGFVDSTSTFDSDTSPLQHCFIFEPPEKGCTYVVGVDGSHGDPEYDSEDWTRGEKDPSAVVVLKAATPKSKPEQVATWTGYIHPTDLSIIAEKLGKMYCDKTNDDYPAMMACEVNAGSPSAITQMELQKRRYPHFYVWPKLNRVGGGYTTSIGWETTPKSRPWITSGLVKDIEDDGIIINSIVSLEQMKTFVKMRTEGGQIRLDHAPGYHDDELFATGIALYCSQDPAAVGLAREAFRVTQHSPTAKPEINYQATGMMLIDGELVVITPGFVRGDDLSEYNYPIPQ